MASGPHTVAGFAHRWEPGQSGRTLLLLHGTGADENDLIPLARQLAPHDNLLSPRGKVSEMGALRYFRRHAPGVFDLEDLHHRTVELAAFLDEAAARYGFDRTRVIALGYSNGANIATSLLFERPEAIAHAVLLRAVLPFEPKDAPKLHGRDVLLLAGERDPYSGRAMTDKLAAILETGGARVETHYADAGHELTAHDLGHAQRWLSERGGGR